eukprot:11190723-Lingulodinium_polyedra.AAC.1
MFDAIGLIDVRYTPYIIRRAPCARASATIRFVQYAEQNWVNMFARVVHVAHVAQFVDFVHVCRVVNVVRFR